MAELKDGRRPGVGRGLAAIHGYQRRGRIEGAACRPRPTGPRRPSTAINAVAELKGPRERGAVVERLRPSTAINAVAELKDGVAAHVLRREQAHPRLSTPWPN